MKRRAFIGGLVGGVATGAAVRTWPFRVYSFPTELRILSLDELRRIYVDRAMAEIGRAMEEMADRPNALAAILFLSPSPPVIPCRVSTEMLVEKYAILA